MIEIVDKETQLRCKVYYDAPRDYFDVKLEKLRLQALKAFMKLCKEVRRDKTSNHR